MLTKFGIAGAAILLAFTAPAMAQMAPDERQDQAQVQRDSGQVHKDNAEAARLDSTAMKLRERAKHETGPQREADLAEADRLVHQSEADYRQARGSYGAAVKTDEDLRHDEAAAPH